MDDRLKQSFIAGVERVAAWADLLADSCGLLASLTYPLWVRRITALRRMEEGIERICRDGD